MIYLSNKLNVLGNKILAGTAETPSAPAQTHYLQQDQEQGKHACAQHSRGKTDLDPKSVWVLCPASGKSRRRLPP